jgi:hypothetical protein
MIASNRILTRGSVKSCRRCSASLTRLAACVSSSYGFGRSELTCRLSRYTSLSFLIVQTYEGREVANIMDNLYAPLKRITSISLFHVEPTNSLRTCAR